MISTNYSTDKEAIQYNTEVENVNPAKLQMIKSKLQPRKKMKVIKDPMKLELSHA